MGCNVLSEGWASFLALLPKKATVELNSSLRRANMSIFLSLAVVVIFVGFIERGMQ